MNKISIIKKIQLGENIFPIDNPFSKTSFSFYCANGGIRHDIILSAETSHLLDSLLQSRQINETDLIENNVLKLKKAKDNKEQFSYRYQIYNSKECNHTYLVLFEIDEYRDYFSCIVEGLFQIESNIINMSIITAQKIKQFLFDMDNGFLIKYHIKGGIDLILLDELYEILEELKRDWKHKDNVPKDIIYHLMTIVPGLYYDLELYKDDEEKYYLYDELIYNLSIAIEMCLNPDINDPHYNTPLKNLGCI